MYLNGLFIFFRKIPFFTFFREISFRTAGIFEIIAESALLLMFYLVSNCNNSRTRPEKQINNSMFVKSTIRLFRCTQMLALTYIIFLVMSGQIIKKRIFLDIVRTMDSSSSIFFQHSFLHLKMIKIQFSLDSLFARYKTSQGTKLVLLCEVHTLTKFWKIQQWFQKVNKYTKLLNESQKKFSPELSIFIPLAPFYQLLDLKDLSIYFILGGKVRTSEFSD